MLKLLRVMKLKRILMKFEEYIITDSMDLMVTFLNITLKIIIIAHYMSCISFYIGLDEYRLGGKSWVVEQELLDTNIFT